MQIKTFITILICSLLISCSDPGEEYVTIKYGYGNVHTQVVKISDVKWAEIDLEWKCELGGMSAERVGERLLWRIGNPEDAKKVDAYMNN